jgi:RND superfamily putative drug exporter
VLTRLTALGLRRPRLTLALWVLAIATFSVLGIGVEKRLSEPNFIVSGTESARAFDLQRQHFGGPISFAILVEGPQRALDRDGPRVVRRLRQRPDVKVLSPWEGSPAERRQLRPRRGAALVVVNVTEPIARAADLKPLRVAEDIEKLVEGGVSPPLHASVTGQATIGLGLQRGSLDALKKAELIAGPLLLLILLMVFRSPVAAAIPILFGGATVAAGFGALSLVATALPVDALATTFASMLGLALGVDYSLLIVSRFREEMGQEGDREAAAVAAGSAAGSAGRTVAFAGFLLVAGMGVALAVLPGGLLFSAAVGAVIVTLLSVASAVLVLPSLLCLLGTRVEKWRIPGSRRQRRPGGLRPLARRLAARPALVAAPLLLLLVLLATPASGVRAAAPNVDLLPADSRARQDYERFTKVLGPGFGAGFAVVVASPKGVVTQSQLLRRLDLVERRLARDRQVALVVGPGSLAKRTAELRGLPRRIKGISHDLAGGRASLGRLDAGLGRASDGAGSLGSGLRAMALGAGQLRAGSLQGEDGRLTLSRGLDQAAVGAGELSAGVGAAHSAAGQIAAGSGRTAAGARELGRGVSAARAGVASGSADARRLAAGLDAGGDGLTRLREPAQLASSELAKAFDDIAGMTIGKADPRYEAALTAVATARGAVDGRNPITGAGVGDGYDGLDKELAGAASGIRSAASTVRDGAVRAVALEDALALLDRGSARLVRATDLLAGGGADLSRGIGRLGGHLGAFESGLGALATGAGALHAGSAQLSHGATDLEAGAATGADRSLRLGAGLARIGGGVAGFGDKLGAAGGLSALGGRSPHLFESGYLVLAALDGAAQPDRDRAGYVVNLSGGGQAARMLVVPAGNLGDPRTEELHHRLQNEAHGLKNAGLDAAVGGEAGEILDFERETLSRLVALIVLLSIVNLLILIVILRSLLLPALAIGLNLVTVAVAFGVLTLLFQGDSPPLGGPGYIDTFALTGTFTVIFALSIDYQVFLLARMREGYLESGTTEGAIAYGLGHTARVIVGAAAIMVGVFAAFSVSDFITIRQLGTGLAVAILLDATVVRLCLLPALMRVFDERCWWLPGWLDRLLPRLEIEGAR